MGQVPLWRQGYDALERRVDPQVRAALDSEGFAHAVGLGLRLQQTTKGAAASSSRRLLHALNLPAGTDVTRILNELGSLRRQVHQLTAEVQRGAMPLPPDDGDADARARPAAAAAPRASRS